jgi:hypothetical protein
MPCTSHIPDGKADYVIYLTFLILIVTVAVEIKVK